MLEGLHFDVFLGVSWLKEAKAKILVGEGVIKVNWERIVYKLWAKPALFIAEDGIRLYCDQFTVLTPGKVLGVPVCHLAMTGGGVYYIQYKDGSCVEGEFLKVTDSEGFLGQCEIQCVGQSEVILQKNQVLGVLFPLLNNFDVMPNKFISSYKVNVQLIFL